MPPANRFVAGFIGSPKMNFLKARVARVADGVTELAIEGVEGRTLALPVAGGVAPSDEVTLGIRPEHFVTATPDAFALSAEVEFVENQGGTSYLHAPGLPAGALTVETRDDIATVRPGRYFFGIDPRRCHLFGGDGSVVPPAQPQSRQ